MSQFNPFAILLVAAAFMLIVSASFAVIAPSLNIDTPEAPAYPNFPDLDVQGNFTELYAFDETHPISSTQDSVYTAFSPDKRVYIEGIFRIQRYGTWSIIPYWYDEPIFNEAHERVDYLNGLAPQVIVNNWNGSSSNFIVDYGNVKYEAFAMFTPLDDYSNLVDSWNIGRGFNVRLYGNAYEEPDWTVQLISYFSFGGSLIGYFLYFVAYMISMLSVMLTMFGLIPSIASSVIVLVIIAFIGSLLMFLRGSGSPK